VRYSDDQEEELGKGELCHLLEADWEEALNRTETDAGGVTKIVNDSWALFCHITSYKWLATAHFVLDIDSVLAQLSLVFQRRGTTYADALSKIQTTKDTLADMAVSYRHCENFRKFSSGLKDAIDDSGEYASYHGIVLRDYKAGDAEYKEFRAAYSVSVIASITAHFDDSRNPVFMAMRVVDPATWGLFTEDYDYCSQAAIGTFKSEYGNAELTVLKPFCRASSCCFS
jgi:hypothetical protein